MPRMRYRRGPGSTSVSTKLPGWAEIPRATLYYYFSGKDDLIEFFMNDRMDRVRTAIEKAAAS